MSLPSIALPGQHLGPADKYLPGPGTHIFNSQIYASIAGPVLTSPSPQTTTTTAVTPSPPKPTPLLLTISRPTAPSDPGLPSATSAPPLLPQLHNTVLARITRLTPRLASCEIQVINNQPTHEAIPAQIRREDIRATEKDKISTHQSFRVGDLVRAVVISLGDQSGYYLATDRNELGVVMAWSRAGRLMVPVSWKEFWDPVGGFGEGRKVARPF